MSADRRHVIVLGDQLTRLAGPLAGADPDTTTVLLVESVEWGRRRHYHRQKLLLVYAAMRHFATELTEAGFDVRHRRVDRFEEGLEAHLAEFPGARIELMEPADHGIGDMLEATVRRLGGELWRVPNGLWLTSDQEFDRWAARRKQLRMEPWYRVLRRRTGWLMVDGDDRPASPGDRASQPEGGRWNLDADNRQVPSADHEFAPPRTFPADAATREVAEWVDSTFGDHPGSTQGFAWPVTRRDALAALGDFVEHRLRDFGPYEDALMDGDSVLAHSLLSAPLNLGLITAQEACEAALAAYHDPARREDANRRIPLQSVEGFVRQLLGWREFMRHAYRTRMPALHDANQLRHSGQLPDFYWNGRTRMRCMGQAVERVIAGGHSHHIQRLMILGGWALMAGVQPSQVNDWFGSMYVDAFDWVVTPNVLGMSQYADPGFTSKPYVAGGAYVSRMGDHCAHCPYDPRASTGTKACPFTTLYWTFIDRHADRLAANPRTGVVVASWRRRAAADRDAILERGRQVLRLAEAGEL